MFILGSLFSQVLLKHRVYTPPKNWVTFFGVKSVSTISNTTNKVYKNIFIEYMNLVPHPAISNNISIYRAQLGSQYLLHTLSIIPLPR